MSDVVKKVCWWYQGYVHQATFSSGKQMIIVGKFILVTLSILLSLISCYYFLLSLLAASVFKLSLIPDTLCSWESLHFENTWHSGKYTLYVKNQWWHNIYSPKAKNLCFFIESKCLETSFLLLSYRHQRIIIPQFSTQWLEWVPAQLSEGLAHFMDFLNTEMDISIIIFFPKLWTYSLCLREGHLFSAKIFI